jgi:predicted ATPase
MVKKEVIVIIGGPGSGKSTIIEALINKGYCCYPEISREVTLEAKKQGIEQLFLEKPLLFSEMLLEARKKQFQNAINEPHPIVFLDRGIPDTVAYLDFIENETPKQFDLACKQYKYSKIFILPPWQEIYQSDEVRYENYEQAEIIYNFLVKTYVKYGYDLIEVPKNTIENRVLYILDTLAETNSHLF